MPEPQDASQDQAEVIGRIIQSEQKLSDYFTTIITKSVVEQLETRNLMRLRIIGLVFVVVVSVAIPGILSWTRGTIAEQTESALKEEIDAATASLERRFQEFLGQERSYSSFTNYLLYLSERAVVSKADLTSVLLRLENLSRHESIVARTEFPYLLDLVARLAIQNRDKALLDLLEEDLAEHLTSPRTKPRLARYYAERLLGESFTSEAKRRSVATRFHLYIDAAEMLPGYETLLPLQLMIVNRQAEEGDANISAGIRLHVKDLSPQDKAAFIAETVRYSNPGFRGVAVTSRTRRIARAAGQVVLEHRDFYITLLDNVAVQSALINIAEREANTGNTGFEAALSGFRNAFSGELGSTEDAQFRAHISALVRDDISAWIDDDVIVIALVNQNRETGQFSRQHIDDLETRWLSEFESGAYDLIESLQERPISRHLRRVKRDSLGMYREISITDAVGLLAGASDPDKHYWQGDQDKWTDAFKGGPGAMHVGSLRFDESALSWVIQISLPVLNPESRQPIGVITVGIDPSLLED